MNKPTLLLVSLFLLISCHCWGQDSRIIESIANLNKSITTLTADFEETKVMPRLKKQTTRKGTLYFKSQNESLLMDYSEPEGDYSLIKDGVMYVRKGDKQQKFAQQNKESKMNILKHSLLNALNGKVEAIAQDNNATIDAKEQGKNYLLTLTRQTDQKQGIQQLVLIYDKKTGALQELKIVEGNGNYTTYQTTNAKLNDIISDDMFNIK